MLNGAFREMQLTLAQIKSRYARASIPEAVERKGEKDPQMRFSVLESYVPDKHRAIFQRDAD